MTDDTTNVQVGTFKTFAHIITVTIFPKIGPWNIFKALFNPLYYQIVINMIDENYRRNENYNIKNLKLYEGILNVWWTTISILMVVFTFFGINFVDVYNKIIKFF